MVEFTNWFLNFVKDAVLTIFSFTSVDGYSLGYMVLGAVIVGVLVSVTIGSIGAFAIMHRNEIPVKGTYTSTSTEVSTWHR